MSYKPEEAMMIKLDYELPEYPAFEEGIRRAPRRESHLSKSDKALAIKKVHPHKFRRTLATMAIDKGMPIEQLQRLLGHKRIDTTLQYAMVKQSNVKQAHRKYIG